MEEQGIIMDVKNQSTTYIKPSDESIVPDGESHEGSENEGEELDKADDTGELAADNSGTKHGNGPPCQFCSTIGVVLPAEILCENCGYHYCYECLNTLHPKRGPFINHRLQNIRKPVGIPISVFLCPHHDGEASPRQVQVHCATCSYPVCFECTTVKGRHQHHTLRLFKEQAALKMEEVFTEVKKLKKLENDVRDGIVQTEKSFEQLEFQYHQESLRIQQTCASVHIKILEAETTTLERLQESFRTSKKYFESMKNKKEEHLLDVMREIRKFDKILQLNQNDASDLVMSHEAKIAMESRLKTQASAINDLCNSLLSWRMSGVNTQMPECPDFTKTLGSLVTVGVKSILNAEPLLEGDFSSSSEKSKGSTPTPKQFSKK